MLFRLLTLVIQLKKTHYDRKINNIEMKTTDHDDDKYITTQEINKLTVNNQHKCNKQLKMILLIL